MWNLKHQRKPCWPLLDRSVAR